MNSKIYSISKWHEITDYKKFTNKIDGVVVRLGFRGSKTGNLLYDPRFNEHIIGLKEVGVPIGVYFFTNAIDPEEAKAEAKFIVDAIKEYDITLSFPIFIDSDYASNYREARADNLTKETRTSNILALIYELKNYGYRSAIYANETWFNSVLDVNRIKDVSKWCIKIGGKTPPKVNDNLIGWEYGTNKVNGCSANVNASKWYIDIDENAARYPVTIEDDKEKIEVEETKVEEKVNPRDVLKVPGAVIELNNIPLYATSVVSNYSELVNGTAYVWDGKIIRDRIRITDTEERVNKPNGYIGWVDVDAVIGE